MIPLKHVFIINPKAGKKKALNEFRDKIRKEFRDRDYEILITEYSEHAIELSRAAAETGEPVRIYACGGDGTVNEVVCGAAGYENAAVTNVPLGTGNDFLKIFGPGYREGFSDLTALAEGPQAKFDLMDCNGRLGLGVICAGVDARIAADVHKYRRLPIISGIGAYILALVENVLFKDISRPAVVQVAGKRIDGHTTIICICNGRFYGGGFMPVGDARPDDGVLDMLVVPKINRMTFFRLVGKYAKGLYRQFPDLIQHYHVQEIEFSSGEEIVTVVDGEIMRDHGFRVCLSDQKINFFYPATLDYKSEEISTQEACL